MNNIKLLRERKGLTQSDLALCAGISFSSVLLLEEGERDIPPNTIKRLCDVLGCEPADLFARGKTFITSDLHLFHNREFIYKPRGFNSVEEMNEKYINEWNTRVTDNDDIYILGDWALGSDLEKIVGTIMSLPGQKHLVIGNHDTNSKVELYRELGIDVAYTFKLETKKYSYLLTHYPTITANLESDPNNCVINLHGHIHTKERFYEDRPYMINVSVDANDHILTLPEIEDMFERKVEECKSYLI